MKKNAIISNMELIFTDTLKVVLVIKSNLS